jgi:hypothetical protein
MVTVMGKQLLALATAFLLPAATLAQNASNFECSYGNLKRRLVIVSEPGVSVPCEVHYFKDNEAPGEHQVLWRATNEAGYCEMQADQFRLKLVEWGWDCGDAAMPARTTDDNADGSMSNPVTVPVDETVDDTDVLEPVIDDEPGDNS